MEAGSDLNCTYVNGISPLYVAENDRELLERIRSESQNLTKTIERASTTFHYQTSNKDEQISEPQKIGEGQKITQTQQTNLSKQCVYLSGGRGTQQSVFPMLTQVLHKVNMLSCEMMYRKHYESVAVMSTDIGFKDESKLFRISIGDVMETLSIDNGREEELLTVFKFALSGSCSEHKEVVKVDEADALNAFLHPAWECLTDDKPD